MKNPAIGAILSLLIGFIVVYGIETIAHLLFPVPFKMTLENLEEYMNQIPTENMLMVILAHFLGGATAIFACLKLTKKNLPAYIVAGLFFSASAINLFLIPHPVWFLIADVTAIILGMVLMFKFFRKKPAATA